MFCRRTLKSSRRYNYSPRCSPWVRQRRGVGPGRRVSGRCGGAASSVVGVVVPHALGGLHHGLLHLLKFPRLIQEGRHSSSSSRGEKYAHARLGWQFSSDLPVRLIPCATRWMLGSRGNRCVSGHSRSSPFRVDFTGTTAVPGTAVKTNRQLQYRGPVSFRGFVESSCEMSGTYKFPTPLTVYSLRRALKPPGWFSIWLIIRSWLRLA